MLIKRKKIISFLRIECSLYLLKKHFSALHTRMLCAIFGWNWPSGSGEKEFYKFHQCIFAISFSPLGKGCGPSFEQQTWILFTQRCFLPSFVEIGIVVLERKLFKFFWTFLLDHYSLPLENCLLYPSILCIKFGWNWPSDSGKRRLKYEQTDNRLSENLTWTFNSGESKTETHS